ncbi:coproporphyrinogen-III oxidase family protein [Candidatus Cytomitobacter primus]|nr:coproporphyrinogen-III oxidase family protein [Candidatus Cytomitobacter primus]
MNNKNTFSLYIHWPFCRKKCSYCDLNSHVRDSIDENVWIDGLIKEMHYWHKFTAHYKMETIFFGGGTPSLIQPKNIEKIIKTAKTLWKPYTNSKNNHLYIGSNNLYKGREIDNLYKNDEIEITLETNPSSLEANSLREFKNAGINRISFGVQSLDDDILHLLNRTHNAEEALKFIQSSLDIFNNVSVDIMYGLPTHTLQTLQSTLDNLLKLNIHHISIYELTLQKNTLLNHQIENKELFLPCDEQIANEYELILKSCKKHEYNRYEISSFSLPGYESRHNQNYWHSKQFIGIGPGAHGRIFIENENDLYSIMQTSTNINESTSVNKNVSSNQSADFTIIPQSELNKSKNSYNSYSNEITSKKSHYYSIENSKIPEKWLEKVQNKHNGLKVFENIDIDTQIQEFIMMGLRVTDGFSILDFESRFQVKFSTITSQDKINKLLDHNYIEINQHNIKLTYSGIIRHGAICKYLIF